MAATCQHKRQIASSQAAFVTAAAVLASVDEERSNLGIPAGVRYGHVSSNGPSNTGARTLQPSDASLS